MNTSTSPRSFDLSSLRNRVRGNSNPKRSSIDDGTHAAVVHAARQAFEEREAAKDEKYDRQRQRAEERELKKQEKKFEKQLSEQEGRGRSRSHSFARRLSFGKNSQSECRNSNCFCCERASARRGSRYLSPEWEQEFENGRAVNNPKEAWLITIAWLRTRILRIQRKIQRHMAEREREIA